MAASIGDKKLLDISSSVLHSSKINNVWTWERVVLSFLNMSIIYYMYLIFQAGIVKLKWDYISPLVYTACLDGVIRLWDARNGQCVTQWAGHQDAILDFDISRWDFKKYFQKYNLIVIFKKKKLTSYVKRNIIPPLIRLPLLYWISGFIRGMTSNEEDNLVLFFFLSAYEIWPDKSGLIKGG